MSADALSEFLRTSAEPLQYAAFFGALILFGLLELIVARRSAGPRVRRWTASFSITFLNIMVLGAMGGVGLSLLLAADYAASTGRGLLNDPAIPAWAAFALGLMVRSFASYLVHVANHKVPWMWRVHRLHHTDLEIDISTTARFHPLEFVYSTPIMLVVVLAFGIPPLAIIVFEILDAGMAVFNHANIRLPARLNRVLAWVLVTPDVHRVHHSIVQKETDSNFGVTVTWWDRICGTYRTRPTEELATMRLGLKQCQDARTTSLSWLLVLPFIRLAPVGAESEGDLTVAARRGSRSGLNGELETIYILIRAIRASFHLLGNVGDDLHRQFGITASMRAVMESLYEGGPQTVPQVARSKSVTRQHIQTLVDQLLQAELAVATPNPDHKRSPLIELTQRGHDAFEDMQRREQSLLTQLTAALPARDLMIAVETIRKLNEQLQQLNVGAKENESS